MISPFKTLGLLLTTTFLTAPAWADWTPENKADSPYSIVAGTASDYNFITTDGENTSYWKINLNTGNFGTSDSITWSNESSEASTGSIQVKLPNQDDQVTLYYTYIMPSTYTQTGGRLTELRLTDVTSKVFKDIINDKGAAIYLDNQDSGNINIVSDFIGNQARGSYGVYGGAIYNYNSSAIGDITGNFIGNYADGKGPSGGAIANCNDSTIGDITGDFIGNYINSDNNYVEGGAIYNSGRSTIGNVTGNFIGNHLQSSNMAQGGAIHNGINGTIGDITGDFIGNYVQGDGTYGGAIHNDYNFGIGNITGNFIGNYAKGSYRAYGGAIVSFSAIGDIVGDFIGNYVEASPYAYGGAIFNLGSSTINSVTGNFIGNHAQSSNDARGGAIINQIFTSCGPDACIPTIGNITADFVDNYAESESNSAYGGAIYNDGTMEIVNSSFINNHVKGNELSRGGAIYSTYSLNITANDGTSLFDGNKVNSESNDIYMAGTSDSAITLNLSALNNGTVTFNDGIDGENYNLNISGDGTGVVKFNNTVDNVNNMHFYADSITHLGVNADINAKNMIMDSNSRILHTSAANNSPIITVDVEVDKDNNTVNAGQINISGDVSGDYRVLVNSLNPDVLDNLEDAVVPFLFAPDDSDDTSSGFAVSRVIGSPYMWDGAINVGGETQGSTWYLNLTDEENPDYEPEPEPETEITPEVAAALGLHEAAIEQTRSVVRNARNKIAATRGYCPGCGIYPDAWDGKMLRNIWVLAQGETANIEKPVDMDADIWGVEAGFDIQNDVNNTLGVFASYRKGEYDLSGKTSRYARTTGSEIDINSWLGGLYYRYDKNMNWLFATVYGGIQKAEAKTDDGIAKFKTDGIELGASLEAGHTFALTNDLTLDPSLGIFYTQVDFDKAHDNVGKEYDWKTIKHLEAELGAKLTKQFENSKVYAKPSVIQTLTGDDRVKVTEMGKADTYHDQTLGRIEIGGDYSFNEALTAYAWANYTFGSSYDAFAGGVGLNYAW